MRLSPAENKINIKAPEYGAAVEWHQDWAFYPHTNDDLLAIGVALDDCEEENGPLMVIPGSHKGPYTTIMQGISSAVPSIRTRPVSISPKPSR